MVQTQLRMNHALRQTRNAATRVGVSDRWHEHKDGRETEIHATSVPEKQRCSMLIGLRDNFAAGMPFGRLFLQLSSEGRAEKLR